MPLPETLRFFKNKGEMQVLLAVFTFLSALRFRKDVPLNQVLSQRYGRPLVSSYRHLQKTHLRRDKAVLDLQFLNACKSGGVIPKLLYFKVSLQNFTSSKLYRSILFKCLDFEIKRKEGLIEKLKGAYTRDVDHFKTLVSWLDFKILLSKLTKSNRCKLNNVKQTHKKKLLSLGVVSQGGIEAGRVIFNFSHMVLTKGEEEVLKLGLQLGLPVVKQKFVDHFLSFERLLSTLTNNKKHFSGSDQTWAGLANIVKSFANESFSHRLPHSIFAGNKHKVTTLKNLRDDKSIVISKPDKGRGVVILNKVDYITKTEEILQDATKFRSLSEDWFKCVLRLEDRLNRFLRTVKTKLGDNVYNWLFASGSTPGILYGLPKVHKEGCPIRPILSAIGTFNYNLAKFFVPILAPLTSNKFTIKNSIDFTKEILNTKFSHSNFYMASFDVKSLFTNIPLIETVQICVDQAKNLNLIPNDLTPLEFETLLSLATKESVFIFNNQLYKQVDGVAMGSPLGPTLANAFLCYHETKWLDECPLEFKPLVYNRYVDDCFLVFQEKGHVDKFLNYLNSRHNHISFTVEHEVDNSLPFLDVRVTRSRDGFSTDVFRKDTYTGLGLNFNSFVPSSFKFNSIQTLLVRAFNICSSWISFDQEINRLKLYFTNNGYPLHLFETKLKHFLSRKINGERNVTRDDKEVRYVSLPFQGPISLRIRNKLRPLLHGSFPGLQFRFIFSNSNTIGSFFRLKDRLPNYLCSEVVYSFSCPDCQIRYIGSTHRNLKIRISEHKGRSYRTGRPLTNPNFSVIRNHSREKDHIIRDEDFKILYRSNHSDLRIVESLFIYKQQPQLNVNEAPYVLQTLG